MIIYRVTIKRVESFFSEYDDAKYYAKVMIGHDDVSPVMDSIVVLEKGWREKSELIGKVLEAS